MEKVFTKKCNHIALVTLNRPEKRNALDAESICLLADTYAALRVDEEVRVVMLTGEGRQAFSSGADLETVVPLVRGMKEPGNAFERRLLAEPALFRRCLLLDGDIGKPVIAAVNGVALAGGMELVLASDIRIASRTAIFGLPEVRHGLFPAGGATVRLPGQISPPRAMEMLLTGGTIGAQTAWDWGLVNRIVPAGQLLEHAWALAERIASCSPQAVQAIRSSVRRSAGLPEEKALAAEAESAAPILRHRKGV